MKLKKGVRRALINGGLLLLAFCVQTGVFPLIPMLASVPNLLLILTFSFGFMYGSSTGMLCGLFAGLLMDLHYPGAFGFYSLIFVYIGYFNGIFTRYYYDDFITLPLILCVLNELAYHFYIYLTRFLIRARFDFGYYFWHIIFPEIIFSLIVTLLIYRGLLKANQILDKMQDKRGQNVA